MARPIRSERNELSQRVFLVLRRKQECVWKTLSGSAPHIHGQKYSKKLIASVALANSA